MSESETEDTRALSLVRKRKSQKSGGFQSMGLDFHVLKGVLRRGYKVPTPIQRKTIPLILTGKDVVAMARTGSGKTAAFLIPMLQKLKRRCPKSGARALLIAPTRELALQTFKFTREIGKYSDLKLSLLVGGDNMEEQFAALHESPDIVIATPGRLVHVAVEMNLKMSSMEYVVFDEADRLFEMGFEDQLKEILARLPENRQTLLFSATLPKSLVDFVKAGLNDPTLVRLDVDSKISDKLQMSFFVCRTEEKLTALVYTLRHIIDSEREQTIVFCATKHHVEYAHELLSRLSFRCTYLYSSLDPTARKLNVERFRAKKADILVVTDLAARGVDIPLLDNVINLHFTPKSKLFVHRVGRVARAGRHGKAFSIISAEEMPYVVDLFLFLGRPMNLLHSDSCDESSKGSHDADASIGLFPINLLEIEDEIIRNAHDGNTDLEYLRQGCVNAYKQYVRTRPTPSRESVERVKRERMLENLELHSVFNVTKDAVKQEKSRSSILDGLKNYRPKATVFELNMSNKDQCWLAMKAKRKVHDKFVSEHAETSKPSTTHSDEKYSRKQQSASIVDPLEVKNVFSEIIQTKFRDGKNSKSILEKNRAKKAKISASAKDAEYFLPYQPKDFHQEQGLSLDKKGFDHEINAAVVDFTTDEAGQMHKQKNQRKWDRKKKRFVTEDNSGKNKKIKTESGVWIPASYKSDMYSKWLKKTNAKHLDNDDEEENEARKEDKPRRFSANQSNKFNKHVVKTGGRIKPELKSKDQIMKMRRHKEKVQAFQSERRERRLAVQKRNKKNVR